MQTMRTPIRMRRQLGPPLRSLMPGADGAFARSSPNYRGFLRRSMYRYGSRRSRIVSANLLSNCSTMYSESDPAVGTPKRLLGLHASKFHSELTQAYVTLDWPRVSLLVHGVPPYFGGRLCRTPSSSPFVKMVVCHQQPSRQSHVHALGMSHEGERGQLADLWDCHQPTAGRRGPRHPSHVLAFAQGNNPRQTLIPCQE